MRLLTGDECGILKECLPGLIKNVEEVSKDEGISIVNPHERPSRRRGVVDLSWTTASTPSHGREEFAVLRMDGTVQVWNRHDRSKKENFGKYRVSSEIAGVFEEAPRQETDSDLSPLTRPMGLSRLGSEDHLLTACNAQGIVSVLSLRRDSKISVVRRFSTLGTSTTTKDPQYSVACCMGVNEAKKWVAVGGKDRETSIYDVESAARVWKTKNLAPDPQTLLQPITWPSAIHFLRDPDRMVVGNGLQVRLYDVRADSIQRRPVAYTPPGLLEQRVTCFSQTGEHALVVADTAGYLLSLDLRNLKSATTQARYVGPAGSVRQLAVHSKLPRMAAVGLDRMLHLYDTKTCRPLACMYLKQRLNCVLMDDEANYSNDGDRCYAEDDTVVDGRSLDQEDDVRDYMDSDQEQEGSNASHHESEASHDDESSVGRGNQTSSDDDEDEDDGTEESAEEIYTERHSKRQRK